MPDPESSTAPPPIGEMAARVAAFDWSTTPLGPRDAWSAELRTAVAVMLGSRVAMMVWWGPGLVNLYNDAYAPMLGQKHPAALGRSGRDVWADVWADLEPQVRGVFERGEATFNERLSLVLERNGVPEDAWFTFGYSPIPDGAGGVGGLLNVVVEDTARVRAERETASVLASTTDAVINFDRDWRMTYVNAAAEQMLGARADTLLGQTQWEAYPATVGTVLEREFRRAVAERVVVEFENHYAPWDRWYALRGYPTADGGLSVYFRDVTEPRRSESAIRAGRDQMEMVVRGANVGVWYCPLPFDVLYWDAKVKEHFHLAPDDPVTIDTFYDRIHPDDRDRTRAAIDASIRDRTPYEIDYRTVSPDGARTTWVRATGRTFYDDAGRPVRFDGVTVDVTARRRVEQELRDSESRLADVIRTSLDAVITMDHRGHVTGWNPAAERTFGYAADEVFGREMAELIIPPRLRDAHRRGLVRRLTQDEGIVLGQRIELPAVRRDGTEFPIELTVTRVTASDPPAFTGFVRDITDRKRAEDALRESEAHFRSMADAAPAMLWITDPDGQCTFLSRGWYEYTGQTTEQGWGLGWTDAIHAEDKVGAGEAFLAANRSRVDYAVDFRLRRADGVYRWVLDAGRPRYGPDGAFQGFIGSVIDVDDRKRAADAARASDQRYRGIFGQATAGIAQIDLTGRFVEVNDRFGQILGRSPEALRGLSIPEVTAPEHVQPSLENFGRLLEHGTPFELEKQYLRPDGTRVWASSAVAAVTDEAGRPRSVVAVTVDITDRKRVEAQRQSLLEAERAARADAEAASQMKDEFLATLSHELRTPLSAILGWSQILSRGAGSDRPPSSQTLAEGLATIERNARAQTQIIDDLLDMSRIISGKLTLDARRIDLSAVVRAATDTVRAAATAKEIRILFPDDAAARPVLGDVNRLQQVFWNLLTNAIKFTPRGGVVEVRASQRHSQWQVDVVDTGEGIAEAFLPYVFDRFRQADASTTRKHGGLGLGLAIVKQLVELHGGRVRVRSEGAGRGATFTVSLPVSAMHATPARPEADAGRAAAAVPPSGEGVAWDASVCDALRGRTVLVVDDEPDARALVRQLLVGCDCRVLTAESADEAVALIERERPDVLVSDVGMPGEDGYALLKRVRALGADRGGSVPAIALTAYARAEDRVKAIRAGFQMHVPKPVEPAELVTMVASLVK